MKLHLTIAELARGGAERVVIEIARGMLERGHEVVLSAAPGPLDAELAGLPIERVELPAAEGGIGAVAANARVLRLALRDQRPDVVHAHNVRASMTAGLARRLAGRKARLITTFHGVPPEQEMRAARILRRSDLVVCVSAALADRLEGAGLERPAVVHNAVGMPAPLSCSQRQELDRNLGLDDGPVVSIVARLVPQKAHGRFLAAARLLVNRHPGIRFLVVGDGPLRAQIEDEIGRLGLSENVTMTGTRSDSRLLIARSDVLVFSSDWEGLAIAALESLAAGVPVVSTDTAGMRELLGGGAGVITAPDPGALAEGIAGLLDSDAERHARGAAGARLIAQEFSPERMIGRYEKLFSET